MPTILPAVDGYVDGALVASNPSLVALTVARCRGGHQNGQSADGDIRLLSIGTGYVPRHIAGKRRDWGYVQWQKHLYDIVASGSAQLVDYLCRQSLDGHYHRLNTSLPERIRPYDDGKLALMFELGASADLSQTITWLERNWLGGHRQQLA
jgi:hypothetical protein